MRRARTRWRLAALPLLCWYGCGIPVAGLAPTAPPLESKAFSQFLRFTPVDSLAPTLRWQPLDAATLKTDGEITDVTYELRVWKTVSGYSGTPVSARDGITQPSHTLEQPLEPATNYLWTVRSHFTLAGQQWVTEWGMAGHLLRDQVVPNASCFRFATPPAK